MSKLNFSDFFKYKKRKDGTSFYYLDDEAPQNLHELVQHIHIDLFVCHTPNDWLYAQLVYAFERLAECESEREFGRAVGEVEADCYNSDRAEWLHNPYAPSEVDEVIELYRDERKILPTLFDLIGEAQVRCIDKIYFAVWGFVEKNKKILELGND